MQYFAAEREAGSRRLGYGAEIVFKAGTMVTDGNFQVAETGPPQIIKCGQALPNFPDTLAGYVPGCAVKGILHLPCGVTDTVRGNRRTGRSRPE